MTIPDNQTIKHHISHELLNEPTLCIPDDEDLLLSGVLDSMSVMRLVAWLEAQTGFSIPAADIVLENFGSLNQISHYLGTRVE